MKILQIVHSFVPYTFAGTEVYTYRLSKEQAQRNEVYVFFRINNPRLKEYSLNENNLEGIKTYNVNHTFNHCVSFCETYDNENIDRVFSRLVDKIKPDIIHLQHLLFLSLGIIKETKKRNIPMVFTLNDYWLICHRGQLIKEDLSLCSGYNEADCLSCITSQLCIRKNSMYFYNILRRRFPRWLLRLIKYLYLHSVMFFETSEDSFKKLRHRRNYTQDVISQIDYFIAPSKFIQDKFINFSIPSSKVRYCQYGFDHAGFLSIPKAKSNSLRFGYIGILLPMKGVSILLGAFKKINNKDIKLFIFGKVFPYVGYEGYPRSIRNSAKLDQRIKIMGEFNNNEIDKVFSSIDILIVPSIWPENSPLVIQEAFLAKTPVIASRIGGIPELVQDGVNGLLFNPGDAEDLQRKMEYVINNPDIINKFKENTPPVKDIASHAKEIEEIYQKLIR